MPRHAIALLFLVLSTSCCISSSAWGQLFGARSVGRPLTGRSGGTGAGELQGSERYVRGNRGREFVGSDRRDTQGFVGSEQGRTSGSLLSSIAGLREARDRTAELNKPLAPTTGRQLYPPRLRVDSMRSLGGITANSQELTDQLEKQLRQTNRWQEANQLEVSVVNRTAILRGVVTSADVRDLAEILVLFEPGISQVQNDLAIRER